MPTIINDWIQKIDFHDLPHSLIWAAGYLWIGCETLPGSLVRMDPANPSAWQAISFPNDGRHEWLMDLCYIPAKGKIYCLFGHPYNDSTKAVTVTEVDPATLAWSNVIFDLGAYNPEQGSMCFDENHMYIACRMSDVLLRYRLSDWVYNGSIPMGMGGGPHCCRYDFQLNRIFVTSTNVLGGFNKIAKVDPDTWTVEQFGVGFAGHQLFTDDMAIGPDYVYCGSEESGYVTRFSKFDLNNKLLIPIPHTGDRKNYCVYYDNTWIWTSLSGSPGVLARINPLTLEVVTYDFPDSRQTSPNEIWHRFDQPGDRRLYFTFWTVPGVVSASDNMAGAPAGLHVSAPSVDGVVGQFVTRAFSASGGDPPYTFIMVGGALPPGLALASNGVYSGTPTTAGDYSFFVTVTDGIPGNSDDVQVFATIAPEARPPVVISAPSVDGTVGISMSRQFTATGGVGPYSYSVTAGSLPLGLTLDPSGLLSGVPGAFILFQPTVYHFTVTVRDSGSGSDSVACTSLISPASAPAAVVVVAPALGGRVGVAYSARFTAVGNPPYTFSITAGTTPPGLSFVNGLLSGTPTTAGTYPFTVGATDATQATGTEDVQSIIEPPSVAVVISAPDVNGTAGIFMSRQFTATGGVGSYTFSVTAGSLPLGLTLNGNGLLAGTPQDFILFQPTIYHFTVTVTDGTRSDSVACTSLIAPSSAPLAVVVVSPALGGRVGVAYSAQFTAVGNPPYSFFITGGQPTPPGLSFINGLLSGVPTVAGTYPFTVMVTDATQASGTADVQAIIEAAAPPPPTTLVLVPPASFDGRVGVVYSVTFGATGGVPPYSFTTTAPPPGLTLTPAGVLSGVPTAAGTFQFTVTVTDTQFATSVGAFVALIQPGTGGPGGGGCGAALPPGLTIDSTGKVTGIPTEPGKYVFTVRICDNASPPSCIDITCSITVFAIDCDAPPGATLGEQYVHKVKVEGLDPGQYVVSASGLPPGLTMDNTGAISGVPRQLGSYFFTVTVCDFSTPPTCLSVICFINVALIVPVPMESFWVMDIADRFNDPIVSSIPLLPGAWPGGNILASVDYLGIGSAVVVNQNGGVTDRPDPSDLGTGFCLLWDSNEDFGQSTPFLVPVSNQPNHRILVTLPINGTSVPLNLRMYYNACGAGSV